MKKESLSSRECEGNINFPLGINKVHYKRKIIEDDRCEMRGRRRWINLFAHA